MATTGRFHCSSCTYLSDIDRLGILNSCPDQRPAENPLAQWVVPRVEHCLPWVQGVDEGGSEVGGREGRVGGREGVGREGEKREGEEGGGKEIEGQGE